MASRPGTAPLGVDIHQPLARVARARHAIGLRRRITAPGARALADFREERVQVLTDVAVLTEGFDDPGVSCIAMACPTRSDGLYAQCVGRGTRLHPGKKDCRFAVRSPPGYRRHPAP